MDRPTTQSDLAPSRSTTVYVIYCALIALALLALKMVVALDVPASAMFSDDYSYLNKSIYYLRGDWSLQGYIFQNIFAGILYPYLISSWTLIDGGPLPRIYFVFTLNALLSAITVFFGSLAVRKASDETHWFTPICLAAFTPLFLMSFVVLTENLVFPLLAVAAWLLANGDALWQSKRRVALLLVVVGLLPLVRAPGLAVGLGVCGTLLITIRKATWKRSFLTMLLVALAMIIPYLVVMYFAPTISKSNSEKREAKYLRTVGELLTDPERWWALTKIFVSQLSYITIATAGWSLTILLAYWLPSKGRTRRPHLFSLCCFCLLSAAAFLAFACLHIGKKIRFDPADADFVFGRYDDPAALLVLIAALAVLPLLRHLKINRWQQVLIRIVTPIIILCAVNHVLQPRWATFNQTGLAAFCRPPAFDTAQVVAAVVGVTLLLQIPLRSRWFANGLAILLIVWSTFGSRQAFREYIFPRSARIAISQEAATWLCAETPKSTRVGFDRRVFKQESPTWGFMGLHYQALVFGMYPREFGFARTDEDLQTYDYLFTSLTRTPVPDLPVAWKNKHYVLYKVVPDVKVYSALIPKPLRTPASRDLIEAQEKEHDARLARGLPIYTDDDVIDLRDRTKNCCAHHLDLSRVRVAPTEVWQHNHRLTMAFPNSTATLPMLVYPTGQYYLVIEATSEGCDSDPPRLRISMGEDELLEHTFAPGRTTCCVIDLPPEPKDGQIQLVFVNDGLCTDESKSSIDKNIFIESILFLPAEQISSNAKRLSDP